MSDNEIVTLEGQAVNEIINQVKRSKQLANEFGALAWQHKKPLTNKRFLNNTLVSTLRHSYREDKKQKDGSYRKYKQHMEKHKVYRNYSNDGNLEEDTEAANIDYGEFDAAKYSETCTELYIRDSHRKHSIRRQNFVEKKHQGSSSDSDDSFTVEDKTEDKEEYPKDVRRQRKRRNDWSDTGSLDEYNYNQPHYHHSHHQYGYRHKSQWTNMDPYMYAQPSGSGGPWNEWNEQYSRRPHHHPLSKKRKPESNKHDLNKFESETDSEEDVYEKSDDSDKKPEENDSTSNSEDEKEVFIEEEKVKGKAQSNNQDKERRKSERRNRTKIKLDGKSLIEKISQRSMYADIEEIKQGKKNDTEDEEGRKMDKSKRKGRDKVKRKQRDISTERMTVTVDKSPITSPIRTSTSQSPLREKRNTSPKRTRKKDKPIKRVMKDPSYEKRSASKGRKGESEEYSDSFSEMEESGDYGYHSYQNRPYPHHLNQRGFRGRRPYKWTRRPRGFNTYRGGYSGPQMYPPMPLNPFYASFLVEQMKDFLMQHNGHKKRGHSHSRSRSRSRSSSRSHRSRKKRKHRSKYSRSFSRSRSRRDRSYSRSSSRSKSRRRHYSSHSDKSRSRSRRHTSSHSDRSHSSYSTKRKSHSHSRHRSRSRSYSRRSSRSSSRSRSRHRKHSSHSRESRSHSRSEHKSTRGRSRLSRSLSKSDRSRSRSKSSVKYKESSRDDRLSKENSRSSMHSSKDSEMDRIETDENARSDKYETKNESEGVDGKCKKKSKPSSITNTISRSRSKSISRSVRSQSRDRSSSKHRSSKSDKATYSTNNRCKKSRENEDAKGGNRVMHGSMNRSDNAVKDESSSKRGSHSRSKSNERQSRSRSSSRQRASSLQRSARGHSGTKKDESVICEIDRKHIECDHKEKKKQFGNEDVSGKKHELKPELEENLSNSSKTSSLSTASLNTSNNKVQTKYTETKHAELEKGENHGNENDRRVEEELVKDDTGNSNGHRKQEPTNDGCRGENGEKKTDIAEAQDALDIAVNMLHNRFDSSDSEESTDWSGKEDCSDSDFLL